MIMIDKVDIYLEAGHGGNGTVNFLRGRYLPLGGPDGGDGGRGGDVVILVDKKVEDLSHLDKKGRFIAESGTRGGKDKRHGKTGKNLSLKVPRGTTVYEVIDDGNIQVIADMTNFGDKLQIAKGGKGGRGNVHFATAVNQAPRKAEKGFPGRVVRVVLEYKMMTDICLIGRPNSGKSSLLKKITGAWPRIADYPFSTQQPVSGIISGEKRDYVMTEIPAIDRGSSLGRGLGNTFLQHVERARLIVYFIDGTSLTAANDFEVLDTELALFNRELSEKAKVIVVNKIDLPEVSSIREKIMQELKSLDVSVLFLSAETGQDVPQFSNRITELIDKITEQDVYQAESEIKIFRPRPRR